MKKVLLDAFKRIFGNDENLRYFFAPGRVNLIGEHTDYNGGHVFPCALTIGTYAVVRKREDSLLRFYSLNMEENGVITTDLNRINKSDDNKWARYPLGVIKVFLDADFSITNGLDIIYYGNIPNSSGLSSSASIEVLTAYILKSLFELDINLISIAKLCQKAENEFVGVNCGILDQFAIAMGKKDHAVFLDTNTMEYEYAPLDLTGKKIVIMNTMYKRGLSDSKYNERRAECEEALNNLQEKLDIKALGELNIEQFEDNKDIIKSEINKKRAKHAVYENARTVSAISFLKQGDIKEFGKLMIKSHESLRYDYEVTGFELDTIVEETLKQNGVYGARMTGAGFGGCAISIMDEDVIEEATKKIASVYKNKTGLDAMFIVVSAGDGPKELV